MRQIAVAFAALACAAPAAAQPALQDRYGPPRAAPATTQKVATAYQGRSLTWAGKPAAGEPSAPATPPIARPLAAPAAPPVSAPPAAPAPAIASLPDSLYDSSPLDADPAPPPALQPMAAAPVQPQAPGAAPRAGSARLYSVHREYGMAPDAVAAATRGQGYVLIGPPDGVGPGDGMTTTLGSDDEGPL